MTPPKKLNKIKSGFFERSLSLAKLTLNTGAGLAGHKIGSLLDSTEEKTQKWKAFLSASTKDFSQEVGEMKGSLMKVGQMLSLYGEHFLPPEANEFLKSLRSQSPSLQWEKIKPIIEHELGPEKCSQLSIDPHPIGSASLGQVHKAKVLATGEIVALKIQYPDIDRAINTDLKAIRSFLSMTKFLPKELNSDHLFKEVRTMLEQEMDYHQEKAFTEEYARLLDGDSRFVVPKVYEAFSTKKILTTSFEQGFSIDDPMIASLNQERKNRIALHFLDLFYRELFTWGFIQTDPHPGNYQVRLKANQEDQLVLFDFGAAKRYDESFLNSYRAMIINSVRKNRQGIIEAAEKLGFLKPEDSSELQEALVDFCLCIVEPIFADGEFDFKNTDLPHRITRMGFQLAQKFKMRPPPQEVIFLDRKTTGAFLFCSALGVKINVRKLIEPYLGKY